MNIKPISFSEKNEYMTLMDFHKVTGFTLTDIYNVYLFKCPDDLLFTFKTGNSHEYKDFQSKFLEIQKYIQVFGDKKGKLRIEKYIGGTLIRFDVWDDMGNPTITFFQRNSTSDKPLEVHDMNIHIHPPYSKDLLKIFRN